jgi:hypothetical protein
VGGTTSGRADYQAKGSLTLSFIVVGRPVSEGDFMCNSDLAELIDCFVKWFGKYLQWRKTNRPLGMTHPVAPGSPAEEYMLKRWQENHDREMDTKAEAVRKAKMLADELEGINEDSSNLLKLLHFVDGGGGPDNAFRLWPKAKVALQRLAIRLRKRGGQNASTAPLAVPAKPGTPFENEQTKAAVKHPQGTPDAPVQHGNAVTDEGATSANDGMPSSYDRLLQLLSPIVREAFASYRYAETMIGSRITDRQAYEFLKENGIPKGVEADRWNLDGYTLAAFETWTRQIRRARKVLGEQKHNRRAGRPTGKSVVRRDQI